MQHDQEKLNSLTTIVLGFLLLSPIFDLITSIFLHITGHSTPVVLGIKVGFLIYLFYQTLKLQGRKCWIWYYFLLALYFLVFFFVTYQTKAVSVFLYEGQNLFRTFYFPLLLPLILYLVQEKKLTIPKKYFVFVFLEYLVLLFVPIITRTGFDSYAYSKTGSIGWFYSTNEIGGIFAILGPIFLLQLKQYHPALRIVLLLIYVFVLFSMGTKVPILAFLLTLFLYFIYFFYHAKKGQRKKYLIIGGTSLLIGIIGLTLFLPKTSFYKNLQIHLDFLEIHSPTDLLTFEKIDHFIFSERLSFLLDTKANYDKSSLFEKLFGIGAIENYATDQVNTKTIEMDYYDIFYRYGIIGTILFFLPLVWCFWKKNVFPIDISFSIFFIFLLSFFSGHILVAPSVSFLIALMLNCQEEEV